MVAQQKIIGLDALRFSMAVFMVLYHIQPQITNSLLNNLTFNGFYATSVFFIISGYILSYVYAEKILSNRFSNTIFLIKRFSALYPIHIFTLLMALITLFLIIIISKKEFPIEIPIQTLPSVVSNEKINLYFKNLLFYIGESLFLVQAWDYRYIFLNGTSWSVSTLFFFYFTFSFLVKKISKMKNLFFFLIIIWFIYLMVPVYFTITQNYSSDIIGLIHRNPLLRLPEFIAGIVLYFLINKYTYFFEKNYISLGFIGFFITYYLVKFSPEKWFYISHNGLFLFFQLALISSFCFFSFKNKNLNSLFSRLGKASLSIYMLHIPLLEIYLIIYKLIIGFIYSNSLSDILIMAKSIKNIDIISAIFFVIILIFISLWMQEKVFTPLQYKLSNKLIHLKNKITQ
ncbi:acyltransferase family protein [Acinetobacter populi]|uniref:Acyltransferase n=1 Tax=Acinetobacter populi TaxID=1582270 RepID=A0A1Z9YZ95_9GAMM|nr:acyltransferase [Acinetobacter populi]OUY07531.1 acyltransferase [Acinetobacter populi]